MKAAVCRGFGQPLVIEDIDIAEPGPGGIKVRLAACAVCHSDIHFGMPATGVTTAFDPTNLAYCGPRVLGSKMGSTRLDIDVPALVDLYKQDRLKLDEPISGRYPLDGINEATASVMRGEALRNVIVF